MDIGQEMTETERHACNELIGAAVVRLRTDRRLTDTDRKTCMDLIGVLVARIHEASLGKRLAAIELQLANLQRATAGAESN